MDTIRDKCLNLGKSRDGIKDGIVDTDFHSLDYRNWFTPMDEKLMERKGVVIGDNVFLGAYSLILKGVHIGNGAVIAAGSIVTKDIPENQVWGGNPAHFIKNR